VLTGNSLVMRVRAKLGTSRLLQKTVLWLPSPGYGVKVTLRPDHRVMRADATIYSISEAARELGLSAEWLREGERRGSLPYAKRDRNNYRYYTPEDVERLRNRRLLVISE
jgi:hypothetical protein